MHTAVLAGLAGSFVALAAWGQPFPMEILAYEGQSTPDGGLLSDVREPEVGRDGSVTFYAHYSRGLREQVYSIWRRAPGGGIAPVVSSFDPVPGIPDATFGEIRAYPRAVAPEQIFFTATIFADPYDQFTDDTLWVWEDSEFKLIAREGDQAMASPPVRFDDVFSVVSQSPTGAAATFGAMLRGPGVTRDNDVALYYRDRAGVRMLFREGQDFSSAHPGVHIVGLSQSVLPSATIDMSGNAVFTVGLGGPNVRPEDNEAIIAGQPGALSMAVRRGEDAPGVGPGLNFGRFQGSSINANGRLAFVAELNRDGMTSRDGEGVWMGTPDDLQLQIRDGETLPGVDGGPAIYSFRRLTQNDRGDWTTIAVTDRWNDDERAVLLGSFGAEPTTVAYSGMDAPGTEHGTTFSDESFSFRDPVLSPAGLVAFLASVEGPAIGDLNDIGLWATTPGGSLELLLRGGSELEVAPGDLRTVEEIFVRHGSTTRNGFDNVFGPDGLLAINVRFTDGTHANALFTVPAPGGLALIALWPAAAARRRRAVR